MRSFVALAIGMLALSGVASAQSPAAPAAPSQAPAATAAAPAPKAEHGYAEVVLQSAFGNVTSQSFGGEVGVTVFPNVQIFGEFGQVRDVATAGIGTAAQLIAGFLSQTQSGVAFSVKEPVTFGVVGVKYNVPIAGSKVRPYVMGGGGMASVKQNVAFTVGGSDITSALASTYGVQLGTDLSGTFTSPMIVIGGGAAYPVWQQMIVDLQFRFGRIMADGGGINVSRAGIGVGLRF